MTQNEKRTIRLSLDLQRKWQSSQLTFLRLDENQNILNDVKRASEKKSCLKIQKIALNIVSNTVVYGHGKNMLNILRLVYLFYNNQEFKLNVI